MTTESSKMAQEQQEALLRAQPVEAAAAEANREEPAGAGFPWLTLMGFAFLTFNSVLAIRWSNGDRATIGFVVFSYINLVLLFVCLRWYERAPPPRDSPWPKAVYVFCLLTMLLTVMFSAHTVAALVPPLLVVVLLSAWLRQRFEGAPWDHSTSSFVTNCAFGGLVGVLFSTTKITGADNVVAVFVIFATAVLSMFVMTVSKMAPGILFH